MLSLQNYNASTRSDAAHSKYGYLVSNIIVVQKSMELRKAVIIQGVPAQYEFWDLGKIVLVKFVLVGTTQPISTSTNFTTQQFHQYEFYTYSTKIRTSGIRTSGDRTSGGPPVPATIQKKKLFPEIQYQ